MLVPDIKEVHDNNEETVKVDFNVEKFDMSIHELSEDDEVTPKMIKYIEGLVRRSYEYKKYIGYLKNELDLTSCSFLESIDVSDIAVSLEFHHHPFTLYDITEAVSKKMIDDIPDDESRTISPFDIADIVTEEHFRHNIGLVPLTKTIHELAHSRAINIPLDKTYGEHSNFKNKYEKYLSPEALHTYSNSRRFNDSLDITVMNADKIKKKIIKYDIKYE